MPRKSKRRGGRKPGTWDLVRPQEIRAYRDVHHMSRAQLATKLGVSSTTIQNWESGRVVALRPAQLSMRNLMRSPPSASQRPVLSPQLPREAAASARSGTLEEVARIVNAYVNRTAVKPAELPDLVQRVKSALERP